MKRVRPNLGDQTLTNVARIRANAANATAGNAQPGGREGIFFRSSDTKGVD